VSDLHDVDALLYAELRRIARSLRGTPDQQQRTSIVHEAWLRLAGSETLRVTERGHLLALAARAMRHLLVDRARQTQAQKRGGGWQRVALEGVGEAPRVVDVLALDQALTALRAADPRAGDLAELRLVAGASLPEAAALLSIGLRTAERDWRAARAFLVVALDLDNTPSE